MSTNVKAFHCLFISVSEEEFQTMQHEFLEKYYNEFDDTEENKFVYTDIHREYVSKWSFIKIQT